MKKALLIIVILNWVSQSYSQNIDELSDNSVPDRYLFNHVELFEWDNLLQEWNSIEGSRKQECNEIYFGIPKSENIIGYYKKYWENSPVGAGAFINRIAQLYQTKLYFKECKEADIKILRINNYKNTQSSLEMNTEDSFSAKGELDTGEKCIIIRSRNMMDNSYGLSIIINELMVSYMFFEQ